MRFLRSAAKLAFATFDKALPAPRGPRVLIYHQVGSDLGRQMEVSLEAFAWQMEWLSSNRRIVDLDTALGRWEESRSEDLVVITFDDGYRDLYTNAYPLLKELSVPFCLYLTTAPLENQGGAGESGVAESITWNQVAEMLDSGLLTLGAHTHTHADLRSLEQTQIEAELETSSTLISDRLGIEPRHFAYPWGYWSETADPIVRALYDSGALGAPAYPVASRFDPHAFHRFPIQLSDTPVWFRSRMEGGLLVEESVRRLIRGYRGP